MNFTRRNFILDGLKGSLCLSVAPTAFSSTYNDQDANRPKFFLNVIYAGGLAHHYLFDSRPASFTAAGLFVNHALNPNVNMQTNLMRQIRGQGPELIRDRAGRQTYAHPLTRQLVSRFQSKMAVINGVHNKPVFDDFHETNRSTLLNGFGGDFFFQKVPDLAHQTRMHYRESDLPGVGGMNMFTNPDVFQDILNLGKDASIFQQPSLLSYLRKTYACYSGQQCEVPHRGLAKASQELLQATDDARELYQNLNQSTASADASRNNTGVGRYSVNDLMNMVKFGFEFGITPYATLVIDANSDSHGTAQAQQDPDRYAGIINHISEIFNYLDTNSFSNGTRTLSEDVVVMVGSEFNRTTYNGQRGGSIHSSGTDHNAYGNSLILYGAGINGLQIFGETDGKRLSAEVSQTDWQHQNFGQPSDINYVLDAALRRQIPFIAQDNDFQRRLVGRPFDFKNQSPLPDETNGSVITMHHVHNSILNHFGVEETKFLSVPGSVLARDEILKFV